MSTETANTSATSTVHPTDADRAPKIATGAECAQNTKMVPDTVVENEVTAQKGDDDDEDEWFEIRLCMRKKEARDALETLMSDYSERHTCARWAADIDVEFQKYATKHLEGADEQGRMPIHAHADIILDAVAARVYQQCGGLWSDRLPADRSPEQGFVLRFYPMDEWHRLPPPMFYDPASPSLTRHDPHDAPADAGGRDGLW